VARIKGTTSAPRGERASLNCEVFVNRPGLLSNAREQGAPGRATPSRPTRVAVTVAVCQIATVKDGGIVGVRGREPRRFTPNAAHRLPARGLGGMPRCGGLGSIL
jgi:hypothetical protein